MLKSLVKGGWLRSRYQASASRTSPINLTNHSYFNLAGQVSDAALQTSCMCLSLSAVPRLSAGCLQSIVQTTLTTDLTRPLVA